VLFIAPATRRSSFLLPAAVFTMSAARSTGAAGAAARPLIQTAYRRLLKAQRAAFDKDAFMQANARKEIRRHFEAPMPPSPAATTPEAQLEEQLQRAREAEDFLLHNIVQAQKAPSGRFVMNVQERHTVPDPPPKS